MEQRWAVCTFISFLFSQVFVVGTEALNTASERAWRLRHQNNGQISFDSVESFVDTDIDPALLYPAHNLSVPIDHFPVKDDYAPHKNGSFPLRYWFDATYYKPGGPVFVLAAGETSGQGRLPFLQKGIIYQLSKATHGLGVILEHRYYGTSFPVPDLSIDNLRFLTTEQALADTRYFAENIVFPGLEDHNLTSKDTAWIAYGGSYAGAFVAFLRTLYPEVFWGAISSSGVTEAIIDYWEYFEPIRQYGPQDCIHFTQDLIDLVDGILLNDEKDSQTKMLKQAFGLPGVSHDADFASTLTAYSIGAWQSRNWDPEVSSPLFDRYCRNVSSTNAIYGDTESLRPVLRNLTSQVGADFQSEEAINQLLNYIGWLNSTIVQPCAQSGKSQDACFGSFNTTEYQQFDIAQQVWRSWEWQVCTQWGYFQTSNVPEGTRPIQSRLVDLAYSSKLCKDAYNITELPDIDSINKHGGYEIEADRLAIIDGEADPWKYATPHRPGLTMRTNSLNKPFLEMEGAVHHWDENGLFPNRTTEDLPPRPVRDGQEEVVRAVVNWVEAYKTRQS